MGTWTLSARYTGCESFVGPITKFELFPSFGGSYLYMWKQNSPSFFYRYNAFAETITETPIGIWTDPIYGGPYRPTEMVYHNGYLYGIINVEYWPIPFHLRLDILQVFRIDPNTGALTLVLDSWRGIGCNRIWMFNTTCALEWSNIYTAKICSWGGMMYIAIGRALPPHGESPPLWCNAITEAEMDTNNHKTAILQSVDGNWWDAGLEADNAHGAMPFDVAVCCVGHETQLCAGWNNAAEDTILFINPGGWDYHQQNFNLSFPETGFDNKFWLEDAPCDLFYAATNFLAAGWTQYHSYDSQPDPPQSPYATAIGGFGGGGGVAGPIVLDAQAAGNLKVYYGKTLDAQIAAGTEQAWAGCVTFRDDYACVQHSEAGVEYLSVYIRDEHNYMVAVPLGMDIDQGDTSLYITAMTVSGLSPFLIEVDTSIMGSGVFRYFTGASGYLYPHAGFGQCYLWGYCSPYLKALLYASQVFGVIDPLGAAKGILPGLPLTSYIGGLHTSPLFDDKNIYFAVITTSGWLGSSTDEGETWTQRLYLPWPVDVVYRNFVSDSIGSGDAAWIGAYGGYACPVKMTPNLLAWGNRCGNLPTITVTDIDSFD